jgi:hypothetical protein
MIFVRYGLPATLVLAGLVSLFAAPSGARVEAFAMFTGAGIAVFLLNLLYRVGVSGDVEREREEAARRTFDETGEWPDEDERPARREWKLPEGIATPESEAAEEARQRER